jgi:hypothetical protein
MEHKQIQEEIMNMIQYYVNKISEKIKDRSGETIVETLISMLIAVLAFMMLAGAIVAAARVNAATEDHTMYVNQADSDPGANKEISGASVTVTVPGGSINTTKTVKTYTMKDSSGTLYYYE